MPLIKAGFSIDRRCPTISTLSAPTTLPIKPMRCIGPPAATSGAVMAKNASRTDGVDHVLGEGRNGVDDAAAFQRDAAVLALRHNDLAAVDMVVDQTARNVTGSGKPVADGEARFRHVDADIIRTWIFGDEIVAEVGAVALRVDRKEA